MLRLSAALLTIVLLVVPLSAKEPAAVLPMTKCVDAGLDPVKMAQLKDKMQAFVKDHQIAGAVTLVAYQGKLVNLDAIGQADLDAKRAMTPDTLFAIASMTKPITGAALMILVDEGKVSLDDPVSKYLPEFKEAKLASGEKPKREITLRDVVTHTSGVIGDQATMGTLRETAKKLAERPLGFQPGEKFQYSPGLSIAGAVIEVASGMPYEKFLQERIFAPLGMKDTTFHPTTEQQARLAKLYQQTKDKSGMEPATSWINEVSPTRTPNPSGGLFSTAYDIALFYQMLLNKGELGGKRVLSEKAVGEFSKIHTGDLNTAFTPGNGWGVGCCVVKNPQGVTGMLSPGTFGHGGAFGTQSWADPGKQMIFVLMIQRSGLPNGDASDLRKELQTVAVDSIDKK
jgi:CubicO group peptidase (beta-lactamase class C family)